MTKTKAERLFTGQIGAEFKMLALICPAAARMSEMLGDFVSDWRQPGSNGSLNCLELGCGTGVTTLCLLSSRDDLTIIAADNEPTMLDQARSNLADWLKTDRLQLREQDALTALRELPNNSFDIVASAYTVHNFLQGYRAETLQEIYRVLKPGGVFANADRYALDDTLEHTRLTQIEARHYFKTMGELGRYDLLEQWIVHLFSDESEDHIMRLAPSLESMESLGFNPIEIKFREGVNTLLIAGKTAQ